MEIPRTFADFRCVLAKAMTDASVKLEPVASQLRYLDLQGGPVVRQAYDLWYTVLRRTQISNRFQLVEPREVLADHSSEVHDMVVDQAGEWLDSRTAERDEIIKTAAAVEQRWIDMWEPCG